MTCETTYLLYSLHNKAVSVSLEKKTSKGLTFLSNGVFRSMAAVLRASSNGFPPHLTATDGYSRIHYGRKKGLYLWQILKDKLVFFLLMFWTGGKGSHLPGLFNLGLVAKLPPSHFFSCWAAILWSKHCDHTNQNWRSIIFLSYLNSRRSKRNCGHLRTASHEMCKCSTSCQCSLNTLLARPLDVPSSPPPQKKSIHSWTMKVVVQVEPPLLRGPHKKWKGIDSRNSLPQSLLYLRVSSLVMFQRFQATTKCETILVPVWFWAPFLINWIFQLVDPFFLSLSTFVCWLLWRFTTFHTP